MDPVTLSILAGLGGLVLGTWDLVRHDATDLLRPVGELLSGMLFGASFFLWLPGPAAAAAFSIAAAAASFISWAGLRDAIHARERRLERALPPDERRAERVMALQAHADSLEAHSGGWIGPLLALVFAVLLVGTGLRAEQVLALFAVAVVMVVPFGRLARHYVEARELRWVQGLLAPERPAGPPA